MEPESYYQKAAEELVVAIRGDRSQRELSQQLGYSFNQIGKWESGSTRIKWDDFLNLTRTLEIPIEKQFRNFFNDFAEDFSPLSSFQQIVKTLTRDSIPWPRATVNRWTRGDGVPTLADVLKILDSRPAVLLTWMSQITDITHVKSLRDRHAELTKRMDLVMSDPLCVYVNAALQLQVYENLEFHDEELLAEHATCSPARLRTILNRLLEADVISFDGKKYRPCPFDFSFSTSRSLKVRSLTKYSLGLATTRYLELPAQTNAKKPLNASRGSVRVVAISSEAADQVDELIIKFHTEVAAIIAKDSKPKDGVQVILVHSIASNINADATGPVAH